MSYRVLGASLTLINTCALASRIVRVEQKNSDGEYLESIKVVQDKTKESLDRQVKKINETLEVSSRGLVTVILSDIQW